MGNTTYFPTAAAALAALTLALFVDSSAIWPADAAPAPAAPTAIIANPPAAPAAPTAIISNPQGAPAAPSAAAPASANSPLQPRIIVIDRNYILQTSSAGKDMLAQAQNFSKQAETQFKTEETQLTNEAGQIQQQLAILSPEVRDQKEKEFTIKQQAFQTRVTQRQAEIQAGFNKAARQIEVALEPILKAIMVERGANMVLDRQSVILSAVDIDITPVAVQRLDKALPHVKVELTPVPAGATAAAGPPRAGTPSLIPGAAVPGGRR
jgi:outer membrane protein